MSTTESVRPQAAPAPPTFDVRSPADGRHLATLPDPGPAEVAAVAAELRVAQVEWDAIGPGARAAHLRRFRDWVLDNEEHLLDVVQAESGKVRQEAAFETAACADVIAYYARRARRFLATRHPRPHSALIATKALSVTPRPYPLVGVITPWNFPFYLPVCDSAPALLAGAAVLLKPSEATPLSAIEAARGWREIGAPDVFRVVAGTGAVGEAVVDAVDYVAFTGSTRTGRRVATRAGERLVPVSLELGGKDAMIVLDDADLERAVRGALWGGLFNSGQVCTSVERLYVQDGIYDRFVERLSTEVGKLRQGADHVAGEQEVGAMATAAQVEIVRSHVEDAVSRGARAVTPAGPGPSGGHWYPPTILLDVDHGMRCMTEETFGPTLPVMRVRDAAEAVRLANDTTYGLSASVWTAQRKRGAALARSLDVGAVNVNDMFVNVLSPPVPMSGWRSSGLGSRFGGAAGLLKYCRTQSVTAARLTPRAELLWYPYSVARSTLAARIVRFAVGRGRRRFLPRKAAA
ncbi:aldehyde dehydrogenase family protein [Pseudonocardia broussonetiae]|uniref:Aldehyde dehydrogenase family protein n=1 Tax=Pseudonocardia broussonetiae TaxID=2736640 RepID=A0A6M6JAA6_9PSEU|nr:aldehyde dehydrogenase family protein [Pseudonocardia broussonetiae]QJY44788.1 aldehyde dehydrogenase family protein [Pseudonocardia broussonetiae]